MPASQHHFFVVVQNEDGSWNTGPIGYDERQHADAQARLLRRLMRQDQVVVIFEAREIAVLGVDPDAT